MTVAESPPAPLRQPSRGVFGLVLGLLIGFVSGSIFGAYLMFISSISTLPVAVDAVARGMAVERVQAGEPRPGDAVVESYAVERVDPAPESPAPAPAP